MHLDEVTPGGLVDYVKRARKLMLDSKNKVNPFENVKVEVPTGFELHPGEALMDEMESIGV